MNIVAYILFLLFAAYYSQEPYKKGYGVFNKPPKNQFGIVQKDYRK